MDKPNTGGPAFPCEGRFHPVIRDTVFAYPGMTLRDYFAGIVLGAMTVNGTSAKWEDDATVAYMAADAMIKARTQEPRDERD